MDTTEASKFWRYPNQENAQVWFGNSAPFEHSLSYNGEYSSPHQHRTSYAPSVTPHGGDLHYNFFSDAGPSFPQQNLDPLSSSERSSSPFQVDSRALLSTSVPQVPPDGRSHTNPLLNTAFYRNHRVGYQPSAHSTGLDEYSRIATRSGEPTPSPYARQHSSLNNHEPHFDARTHVANNLSTLVPQQLPLRQPGLEQDVPQYPLIQSSTTRLSQVHGSRGGPTNSAPPPHALDSQSTSLGITSAQPVSISSFGQGAFQGAHNFTMHNVVMNDYSNSETFMLMLLAETIQDATFDSAHRYPPPRCLQGTRQATIDRAWSFIDNHDGPKKIRCIIGPAGAGKSAVMQTLAEVAFDKAILGGSIFFADDCKDVSKVVTTLAYQLAVNYEPYRQFIRGALMHDPGLPRQSLVIQFRKLIVEPFVHRIPKTTGNRLLVLLDGLDRCNDEDKVCEFLRLVSEFSMNHPTSPLMWVISCRAEPHIMMFLGRVKHAYEEEVLEIGEEDTCRDVERFLRYQLGEIKKSSLTLRRCPHWPENFDIMKIAEASKGFFAYADSVIKFVKDRNSRSRLSQVMQFIDGSAILQNDYQSHPMSTLDVLYRKIMARIPQDVQEDAHRLLLRMMQRPDDLHFMCNWLSVTEDTAYDATYPLHSVLRIPEPENASSLGLQCFHPSFIDYLLDPKRSKMCYDIQHSIKRLDATCIYNLLSQTTSGLLKSMAPALLHIPLSWPEGRHKRVENIFKDEEVRAKLLQTAAETAVLRLVENAPEFQDPFFLGALIAFDNEQFENDPDVFRRLLFTDSRRSELIALGVLKEMPLRMLDPADIDPRWLITCRFKSRATNRAKKPCRCGSFCTADWEECVEDGYVIRTANLFFNICSCSDRFIRQLEIMKAQFPERLITIFLNLKRSGWVEYRFTDLDNCGSEWTYYFYYTFPFATYPFRAGSLTSQPPASQFVAHQFQFDLSSSYGRNQPSPLRRRMAYNSDYGSLLPCQRSRGRPPKHPPSPAITTKHDFMSLLHQKTIHENSDHSLAPCHRGTRSAILSRVRCFITGSKRTKRSYWIIGAAGSGKTAIMHTIAKNPPSNVTVCVSVFLPINTDVAKIITTIAHQVALHYEPYKQFIKDEITLDPSLLRKSLAVQFRQLIVKPFIHQLPNSPEDGRILILIDELEQSCDEEDQRTLLALISDFCVEYPVSPLVWVISSRPEPHIITILDGVDGACEKEEIDVNGTEACEDVQRFLRDELNQIKNGSPGDEASEWPSECDLMKIAGASQGFFAYAASLVTFIKSPGHGSPDSRLQQVLESISLDSLFPVRFRNEPMSLLHRLYRRVVRNVSTKDFQPWLLKAIEGSDDLRFMCNWLDMTEEAAYSVTDFLHSVLRIPGPDQASSRGLECVHPSFIDYIRSCRLLKLGSRVHDATTKLDGSCVRRILEEAPNGTLKNTSGAVANIKLSWPADFDGDDSLVSGDEELKFRMYKAAAKTTVSRMAENESEFEEPFYFCALTAFDSECFEDDIHVFTRLLFDESRRSKFIEHGVLKEISLRMISVTDIDEGWPIRCQFRSSVAEGPHPCSPLCQVNWIKNDEKDQGCWTTVNLMFGQCDCSKRLVIQLEYEKALRPDRLIRVFINLHRTGFIEYQSAEDGESEWIYNIPFSFPLTG